MCASLSSPSQRARSLPPRPQTRRSSRATTGPDGPSHSTCGPRASGRLVRRAPSRRDSRRRDQDRPHPHRVPQSDLEHVRGHGYAELLRRRRKGRHPHHPCRPIGDERAPPPARVRTPHRHGPLELSVHGQAVGAFVVGGTGSQEQSSPAGECRSLTASAGERSVGEIFAEDYVQLNLRTRYAIRWLDPPNAAIRAALRRDLRAPDISPSD